VIYAYFLEHYGLFQVATSKAAYKAENVIIATDFYDVPNLMNIPGEDLPKVIHYYKAPHYYAFSKVLVVGANNSSVDVALETFRKGAEVTMVIRGKEMGPNVKYWVRPDIENRIKEGSIKPYFESNLKEIKEHTVVILAGVVCGGMDTHKLFIENSRVHAEQIMRDIAANC